MTGSSARAGHEMRVRRGRRCSRPGRSGSRGCSPMWVRPYGHSPLDTTRPAAVGERRARPCSSVPHDGVTGGPTDPVNARVPARTERESPRHSGRLAPTPTGPRPRTVGVPSAGHAGRTVGTRRGRSAPARGVGDDGRLRDLASWTPDTGCSVSVPIMLTRSGCRMCVASAVSVRPARTST